MGYLSIDPPRSRDLVRLVVDLSSKVEAIRSLIFEAETLAEVSVDAMARLDEIDSTFLGLARAVTTATDRADAFRLTDWCRIADCRIANWWSPETTSTSPHASSPRLSAWPGTAWNEVHQQASHNSYAVDGGIAKLYEHGIRTFELDIHRGRPTEFFNKTHLIDAPWPLGSLLTVLDHLTDGGGAVDDWLVYHHSADTDSEYEYLRDGLRAIDALPGLDPITLFMDNKDGFGGPHTSVQLNEVLGDGLGTKLFKPQDLIDRAPGATDLHEAIEIAGWPTVDELEGRVIVVLTDHVDDYEIDGASAFVAATPTFTRDRFGLLRHVPDADVVFYNADASHVTPEQIIAIQAGGSLLRTYNGDRCPSSAMPSVEPNYTAVDHEFPQPMCPPHVATSVRC